MVCIGRLQWIFALLTFTGFFFSFPIQVAAQESELSEVQDSEWIEPQAQEWIAEEDYLYRAYFDISGAAGGLRETGQGLLFVPLAQDEESLFFADIRGNAFDNASWEGNFGLAYRRMVDYQWIIGAYGFFDLRRSQFGNTFQQGSFGAELLSIEWDFRVNGYIPTQKQKRVNSLSTAYVSGNNIVVQGGEERAYWGTDFEVGRLLKTFPESIVDAEIRGYAGGYYFDNSAAGFQEIAGPRTRVELRTFDLPLLGNGSRVVLGAQYQYDDLRGSQTQAMLSVRIPLPGNGNSQRLTRFQRRMVTPIVRDIDIVLNQARGPVEQAKLQLTGQVLEDITVIDADTVGAEAVFNAAGADSVVVFDGSAGTINTASGFVFNDGQLALGGGKTVNVVGCNSGAVASFNYGGTTPTIDGGANNIDVFTLADNASIVGMNITGGTNGIFGDGISGFTIACNEISGADENGVLLEDDINGDIISNTLNENGNNGLFITRMEGGTISNNMANENGDDGIGFSVLDGGIVSNNTANENGDDGLFVSALDSGTVSNNTASGNGEAGFFVSGLFGGTISNNTFTGNGEDGFATSAMVDGTFSNNTAIGNGNNGFRFNQVIGGTISNNVATNNDTGFRFNGDVSGGTISDNTATGNTDGFLFNGEVSGGTLSNNTATGNTTGFSFFNDISGGMINNNIANENEGNGFIFFNEISGGSLSNNTANGNNIAGFFFLGEVSGGTISDNTAIGNETGGFEFIDTISGGTISNNASNENGNNGFFINLFDGGNTATFEDNSATNNTGAGYNVQSGTPATGVGTNTGSGNGSNDNF